MESPGGTVPSAASYPFLALDPQGQGWRSVEALSSATAPARWVQTNQCRCGYGCQECPLPAQDLTSGCLDPSGSLLQLSG